jgi:hypothetical protein
MSTRFVAPSAGLAYRTPGRDGKAKAQEDPGRMMELETEGPGRKKRTVSPCQKRNSYYTRVKMS